MKALISPLEEMPGGVRIAELADAPYPESESD